MRDASSPRQITGDDIIAELIRNLEVGAFKVRHTILVPCAFNVYLSSEDYELIHPIADFVRNEAKRALADHLGALNKPSSAPAFTRLLKQDPKRKAEYKILRPDWTIEFHRDEEEHLRRGEIEIYSDLGSAQTANFGAGSMTTFITRRPADAPEAADSATMRVESPAARPVHALLRYRDARGEKAFAMSSEQIVVGRGGKAVWVDLKIDGPADISREHCRIRRDAATGRFFLKDLSQFGTAVNGTPVPTSIERTAAGDKVDRDIEFPLPSPASISLADVFTLEFEAERRR